MYAQDLPLAYLPELPDDDTPVTADVGVVGMCSVATGLAVGAFLTIAVIFPIALVRPEHVPAVAFWSDAAPALALRFAGGALAGALVGGGLYALGLRIFRWLRSGYTL